MKKITFVICLLFSTCCYSAQHHQTVEQKNISIVKNMFSEFAEKLNISKLDEYYTKDFVLESNGKSYSYQEYKNLEKKIYQTLQSLKVTKYDDIFACANKVVSRMTIKLTDKNDKTNEFQVILVALIKNNKIAKIWEITYPSWKEKLTEKNNVKLHIRHKKSIYV